MNAEYTAITFTGPEGDLVWILTPTLSGAYQYFVNRAVPRSGEFRTLWRLDNATFTHGWTTEIAETVPNGQSDGIALVPLRDIHGSNATKVQDETWRRKDGTYITKYDLSAFLPVVESSSSIWGVLGKLPNTGEGVGSWYIHGGKVMSYFRYQKCRINFSIQDYMNGNHLKQELMVHRESITGDTVQLNMIHGTHFQSISRDDFAVGRTWGPWLWYLVGCHLVT